MKKRFYFVKIIGLGLAGALVFGGCGDSDSSREEGKKLLADAEPGEQERAENAGAGNAGAAAFDLPEPAAKGAEPETTEEDWSEYFDGLNGAAVLYDASADRFTVYNSELAGTRRSPCSTFKIISSLIGLENGIIVPENSTRAWSGETFWNESWNHDIDFGEAFRASCVWYFREVADEIGQELMQEELDKLMYGNCDISDWEGRLNTNNNNRALTGFWLESSLMISPKEQTEVMARIFGKESVYSESTREELKKVMLVTEENEADIPVYGKTGMGKAEGIVMDAWFTGFAEKKGENICFCVYLGRTDGKDVSGAAAREIAIRLITDYIAGQGLPR